MSSSNSIPRSLPLALLFICAPALPAQNCTGTIAANVGSVSLGTGGVQQITLSVAPAGIYDWYVIGSFGTNNPVPQFAQAGLFLDFDRYMFRMLDGHAGFVHGGINGFNGGVVVPFDAAGNAQLQIVIPPGMSSQFIGRTLHHGMYHKDWLTALPECGTATVSLTLLP